MARKWRKAIRSGKISGALAWRAAAWRQTTWRKARGNGEKHGAWRRKPARLIEKQHRENESVARGGSAVLDITLAAYRVMRDAARHGGSENWRLMTWLVLNNSPRQACIVSSMLAASCAAKPAWRQMAR
jgi:hypothetical protein